MGPPTDTPLAMDSAIDIGVDDLCLGCARCTIDCPVDTISDQQQWLRGQKKGTWNLTAV
ncbi:MAG: hypothetical protein AAEI92_02325 [Arenicellales bacterium]